MSEFYQYFEADARQKVQASRILSVELNHRSQDYVDEYIDSPDSFVLANEDKIVAVGKLSLREDLGVSLLTLAVDPSVQGKGYGTEILKQLENQALILSGKPNVEISLFSRIETARFYENRGYSQTRPQGGRHTKLVAQSTSLQQI